MECMLGVTKGCLPKENRRHFPDVVKVREGVQYICDVAKELPDVNITCAQQHFPEVFECLRKDTLLIVNDDSIKIPLQSKFICRTYDIVDLCCWEKLQTCGKNTAGAYVRLLSVYLRPPSCPSSGHMTASSSIAVLLISALVSIIWLT
ncbi:hypothetical protein BaRGS_00002289 [Batillaria attramentaria]|uniref:Uncharacterized protein n=1 Tax=Batillaria attramentaria TaxID=370345 RepID=A0ABD0M3A2_9CAEN